MARGEQIDRRAWLARAGALAVGVSGVVLARRDRTVGAVTAGARQTGAPSVARVNLGFVSAYVLGRGSAACIVDTGVPGSADAIGEVLRASGYGWDAVTDLILTHHHMDHAGSAAEVIARAANAAVWMGAPDIPRVQLARSITPVYDGDTVCDLTVVETPGHTLGHISLLDHTLGALITGDAALIANGELVVSPPMFTEDMPAARDSIRKMATLTFSRALLMHGEPIESDAQAAFARLAATL